MSRQVSLEKSGQCVHNSTEVNKQPIMNLFMASGFVIFFRWKSSSALYCDFICYYNKCFQVFNGHFICVKDHTHGKICVNVDWDLSCFLVAVG